MYSWPTMLWDEVKQNTLNESKIDNFATIIRDNKTTFSVIKLL